MRRHQRRRGKGYRLPPGVIFVGRPSPWGNPFRVGDDDPDGVIMDRERVLYEYARWLDRRTLEEPTFLDPLGGADIACWCRVEDRCHGDILIERMSAVA